MTNKFGQLLYELRKEKNMTQGQLAEKLSVTNKAVSKWETGETFPATNQLTAISTIFGVSVDELLKGEINYNGANNSSPAGDSGQPLASAPTASDWQPVGAETDRPHTPPTTPNSPNAKPPMARRKKIAIIAGSAGGGGALFFIGMIILGIILGLASVGIIDCGGGLFTHTITFNTGKDSLSVPSQTFSSAGGFIEVPDNLSYDGYVFIGWSNTNPQTSQHFSHFNFDWDIWQSQTIYAWWMSNDEAFTFSNGIIMEIHSTVRWNSYAINIPSHINNEPVTTIASQLFFLANAVRTITLPATITTIHDNIRADNLREIIVCENNPYFSSLNGILYNRDRTILLRAPTDIAPNPVIPSTVLGIGNFAFADTNLTTITLPNSLLVIGDSAFAGGSLTSITIPDSVVYIEGWAFSNNNLLNVVFGTGLLEIGSSAFERNSHLTNIVLPHGLQAIGAFAFSNIPNLANFTMPNTVTSVSTMIFLSTHTFTFTFLGTEAQLNAISWGFVSHLNSQNATIVFG